MTNDIAQGPVDVSVGQVAENERFSPSVVIDGRTVTPAGWMWVLGFALGGCEWAVIEASKPEFRAQVAEWMRERKRVEAEHEIADMERRIANIRQSLPPNAKSEGAEGGIIAEGSLSTDGLGNAAPPAPTFEQGEQP